MNTSCDQKMKDFHNSPIISTSSINTVSNDIDNTTLKDANDATTESGVGSKTSRGTSTSDCVSKSNNTLKVIGQLQNMSTADVVSVCANCGKEGDDVKNVCNKCNQVKYCNAACKKKHRHKHKKDCEEHLRLAAEQTAKLHDEKLFKKPPSQYGDCPICFLRIPTLASGRSYNSCCGQIMCTGCIYGIRSKNTDALCPFCRTPYRKSEEELAEREKKRIENNDLIAIYNSGCNYRDGNPGYPQSYTKALELLSMLELFHRVVELGNAKPNHREGQSGHIDACSGIGYAYEHGRGVEVDKIKATYYYELAAMAGNVQARHNLGINEENVGNMDRAVKHYMIAAGSGDDDSLMIIKDLYSKGDATKEDYTKALQSYQAYLGEIKSDQRDEAAAFTEQYRYY